MHRRLQKISVPMKLECFIQVALEAAGWELGPIGISPTSCAQLRDMALRRADDMGFNVIQRAGSEEVHLNRRGRAGQEIRDHVRMARPGVEIQPIPESRLPSPAEVLEDARSRIEGAERHRPPSEEQLDQYRDDERIRQGVRKIRFNGIKKEEEEPHQPRLPGLDEDPPW